MVAAGRSGFAAPGIKPSGYPRLTPWATLCRSCRGSRVWPSLGVDDGAGGVGIDFWGLRLAAAFADEVLKILHLQPRSPQLRPQQASPRAAAFALSIDCNLCSTARALIERHITAHGGTLRRSEASRMSGTLGQRQQKFRRGDHAPHRGIHARPRAPSRPPLPTSNLELRRRLTHHGRDDSHSTASILPAGMTQAVHAGKFEVPVRLQCRSS